MKRKKRRRKKNHNKYAHFYCDDEIHGRAPHRRHSARKTESSRPTDACWFSLTFLLSCWIQERKKEHIEWTISKTSMCIYILSGIEWNWRSDRRNQPSNVSLGFNWIFMNDVEALRTREHTDSSQYVWCYLSLFNTIPNDQTTRGKKTILFSISREKKQFPTFSYSLLFIFVRFPNNSSGDARKKDYLDNLVRIRYNNTVWSRKRGSWKDEPVAHNVKKSEKKTEENW